MRSGRADAGDGGRRVERRRARPASGGRHAARRGGPAAGAPPRVHLGRLAVLALVLLGASFYVAPLRAFFAQQDRYQHEAAALAADRASNSAYKLQIDLLSTRSYVAQRARADSMLVPPGTQVFVIKGLPGADPAPAAQPADVVSSDHLSVLDRLDDLWRTLLH